MNWLLVIFIGTQLSVIELESEAACARTKERIEQLFPARLMGESDYSAAARPTTLRLVCVPKGI